MEDRKVMFRFRPRVLVKSAAVLLLIVVAFNTYKRSNLLWSPATPLQNQNNYQRVVEQNDFNGQTKNNWRSAASVNASRGRTTGWITREQILDDLTSYVPIGDKPSDTTASKWLGMFHPAALSANLDIEPADASNLESKLKTRCWRLVDKDNDMICLPYFYLLGFPKSATTDFWYRLHEHPDIVRNYKEHHFWTRKKYKFTMYRIGRYYRQMLNLESRKVYNTTIWQQPHLIIGDGSPSYYWDISYHERQLSTNQEPRHPKEPEIVVANLIKAYTPGAKFITLIRDPAEIVYSHYLYKNATWPKSRMAFHNRATKVINMYYACFQLHSVRTCAYDGDMIKMADKEDVRLYTGFFAIYIHDWLRVFPRDQFLFFKTEEYKNDTASHLKKTFSFLEVSEPSTEVMDRINEYKTVNTQDEVKIRTGQMYPATRKMLNKFFEPFNNVLAELLQDEKWTWTIG